jgi:MFS family permease
MALTIPISVNRTYRISVSVFFFIAGFVFASWASRIPDIKNALHLSDAGLGSVLLALPAGLITGLPLSGFLVSRYGSKKIMIAGAILYPAVLLLLGLAASPFQLVAALFLFGFCGNLLNISVNTQAVGVEAIYGRSIMASFHGLWSLAGFTGAAVSTLMISYSLTPFVHFCIICAASALLIFASYKHALPQDSGDAKQPLFVKPDKAILKLGMIVFGSLVCEGTMFDWSGVYFEKVLQVADSSRIYRLYEFNGGRTFCSRLAGYKIWGKTDDTGQWHHHFNGIAYSRYFPLPGTSYNWFFTGGYWCFFHCAFNLWHCWQIHHHVAGPGIGSSFYYRLFWLSAGAATYWFYCAGCGFALVIYCYSYHRSKHNFSCNKNKN